MVLTSKINNLNYLSAKNITNAGKKQNITKGLFFCGSDNAGLTRLESPPTPSDTLTLGLGKPLSLYENNFAPFNNKKVLSKMIPPDCVAVNTSDTHTELEKVKNDIQNGIYAKYGITGEERNRFNHILNDFNIKYFKLIIENNNVLKDNKYRFSTNDIYSILSKFDVYKAKVLSEFLENDKKIKGYVLSSYVYEVNKNNYEYAYKLHQLKDKNSSEKRLATTDIQSILEHLNNSNKKVLDYLIEAETTDKNGQKEFRFVIQNLNEFVEKLTDKHLSTFKELAEKTKPGTTEPLYAKAELLGLASLIRFDKLNLLEDVNKILLDKSNPDTWEPATLVHCLTFIDNNKSAEIFEKLMTYNPLSPGKIRLPIKQFAYPVVHVNNDNGKIADLIFYATKDNGKGKEYIFKSEKIISSCLVDQHLTDKHYKDLKELIDSYGNNLSEEQILQLSYFIINNAPWKAILDLKTVDELNRDEVNAIIKTFRAIKKDQLIALGQSGINSPLLPKSEENIKEICQQLLTKLEPYNPLLLSLSPKTRTVNLFNAVDVLKENINSVNLSNYNKTGLPLHINTNRITDAIHNNIYKLNPDDISLLENYYKISTNDRTLKDLSSLLRIDNENFLGVLKKAHNKNNVIKTVNKINKTVLDSIEIQIDNKQLADSIKKLITMFPEFLSVIGKENTTSITVDIHLLNTFKHIIDELKPLNLSNTDSKIAELAALFHDIGKKDDSTDTEHPKNSEFIVYQMLKRSGVSERNIERISNLIRNHHWVGGLVSENTTVKDVAMQFRRLNDFELAVALTRSDLKGSDNNLFLDNFDNNCTKDTQEIRNIIKKIQSQGIYMPQTKIPKASTIKKHLQVHKTKNAYVKDGVVVLKINKDTNFKELGFDKNTTYENFTALIHCSTDANTNLTRDIFYASKEGNNGVFSASYINPKYASTFLGCNNGIVLDVDPANIATASKYNYSSDNEKTFMYFQECIYNTIFGTDYLKPDIKNAHAKARTVFSDTIKKLSSSINDENYSDFFNKVSRHQDLQNLEDSETRLIKETLEKEIFFKEDEMWNELIVYAPKPTAVITTDYELKKTPKHYINLAKKLDMPIIIIEADHKKTKYQI